MIKEILTSSGGIFILKTSIESIIKKYSPDIIDFIGSKLFDDSSKRISEYVFSQAKRHYNIKTLYTNGNPQPFLEIYYPLSIFCNLTNNKPTIIKSCDIDNVFSYSNFVSIVGNAGSGKSSLIKYLFLNCIERNSYIPILVELRLIESSKLSIKEFVYQKVFSFEDQEIKLFQLLKKGGFVFFFDGYDELSSFNISKVSYELNQFIEEFNNNNNFIITSRPGANVEDLQQFQTYQIMGLEPEEIYEFTYKQTLNMDGADSADDFAKAVSESIGNIKLAAIREFLTNPLLLTLYIFAFQRDASIPLKKSIFYSRVIEILLTEHDSRTKFNYHREVCSGLDREQFIKILSRFSFYEQINQQYNWRREQIYELIGKYKNDFNYQFNIGDFIRDMKVGTSLWLEESGEIKFSHRSLQEYFAAVSIRNSKKSSEIYGVLIQKISNGNLRDYQNFLSLCEEVDELMFYKFFRYPLLSAICNELKDKSGRELVEHYVVLFHSYFYYENGDLKYDKKEIGKFEALKYFTRVAYGFAVIFPRISYEFRFRKKSKNSPNIVVHDTLLMDNKLTDLFWSKYGDESIVEYEKLKELFQYELQKTSDLIIREEKLDEDLLEI